MKRLGIILLTICVLVGCANPSAGRTSASSTKSLARSAADETLKADIVKFIGMVESGRGGSAPLTVIDIIDIRPVGPGTPAKETWLIDRKGKIVRYEITMTPSQRGGTDLSINGPFE